MLDMKIVEIGYFLSKRGANEPPEELDVNSWKEAYQCFYEKVNPSNKTLQEFENSLKNIRDHFDSYIKNERRGWHDNNGQPDKLPEQYRFVLNYLGQLSDEKLWEYIKPYATSNKELYWQFDISTFRLLGRELITDRITALVELVKNSYDANAKNVYISFLNTKRQENLIDQIIISDDGFGMTEFDIKNKWMKIGTDSKRKNKFTPEPFSRRVVGEKGIGRFAIDKLGSYCRIYTKTLNEKNLNLLTINWNDYQNDITENSFLKVSNKFKKKKFEKKISGLKLVISNLHDIWTQDDLKRVYKELSKIVSPFNQLFPPFNIYINSNEYTEFNNDVLIKNDAFKYASFNFSISYNLERKTQETIEFNGRELKIVEIPMQSFGPINFKLYHFDMGAKGNFKRNYKGDDLQIDGIKIYRDGILTTPFAENEAEQSKKRDILGIDKRRYSGFFDKVNSRDIIGIVDITKDFSPNIIDATNRQDFIDNSYYKKLKEFIIVQLEELEKFWKYQKSVEYEQVDSGLQDAAQSIEYFSNELKNLKSNIGKVETPYVSQKILELEKQALHANIALKKGLKQQADERKEAIQKETMYMSLMSLETYAIELTHIIKTSLGHIKQRAEFNLEYFNEREYKELINEYNIEIVKEIDKLDLAIDFMSRYTRTGNNWDEFNTKEAIFSVFQSYKPILEREKIKYTIDAQDNVVLHYNIVLFQDIINNLLNNSIKILKDNEREKLIKVTSFMDQDKLNIVFSDNGAGVPKDKRQRVFEIYYTTTAESGGNGMGLYMVKTNLQAINGSIEIIDSELGHGASFKLEFRFKR